MKKLNKYIHNIYELTLRNILIFLKNKTTIFFSLLAPILILVIYVLFMGDLLQSNLISGVIPEGVALEASKLEKLTDAWMISGTLGIASLTVALNSMFIAISDKERRIVDDFSASPVKLINLTLSYFISAFILTFTICLIFLTIGLLYLVIFAQMSFTFAQIMNLVLVLLLATLSAVISLMFITLFINTTAAASSFTGIFSALIGFLIGSYLPVGLLPEGIQNFANLLPGSHANALFRNLIMENILDGVPTDAVSDIKRLYGLNLTLFGQTLNTSISFYFLSGSIVVMFVLYLIGSKSKAKFAKK